MTTHKQISLQKEVMHAVISGLHSWKELTQDLLGKYSHAVNPKAGHRITLLGLEEQRRYSCGSRPAKQRVAKELTLSTCVKHFDQVNIIVPFPNTAAVRSTFLAPMAESGMPPPCLISVYVNDVSQTCSRLCIELFTGSAA